MRLNFALLAAFAGLAFAQAPAAWEQPMAQQKWTDAEPLLKQALAEGETAPVLRALATVYRAIGRIKDADPILERLVAIDESVAYVEDLARIKAALGSLDRAEILYRRALELRPGPNEDPLGSIVVHQRLAQVLLAEKKYPEAEQEAMTGISLRIRGAGPRHPDLAGDNAGLARIYEAQKKWDLAAAGWEAVAGIQVAAFGYDDMRLVDTFDSLADCRYQLQRFDQAEDGLRRALAIRELNLGPSSIEVAESTDRLGSLFFHTKRFADAEPFYRRSLDIYLSLLKPGNPALGHSYDNLAVTEAMLEKYEEAESLYREALKLRDTEDAQSLHNLALVLVERDKGAEADALYARALTILDAPNNDNPDLLKQVLAEYSSLLRDLKRPAEAVRLDNRLKGGKQVPVGKRAPVAAKQ